MSTARPTDVSRLSITSSDAKKTIKKGSLSRGGAGSSNPSLLNVPRGSIAFKTGKGGFKVPKYQNTYQLESRNPFQSSAVDKILQSVVSTTLKDVKGYEPGQCMKHCQDMAGEIRKQIDKKDFHRYKYIVTVSIIQKINQGAHVGIGCLWDPEKDNYSTYVFENFQYYAIAIAAGVYYD